MATQKHLDIIQQETSKWNEWRKQYRDIQPDLSGADLSGIDLSGVDLSGVDLSGADLSGARFRGEFRNNFSWANLTGVKLDKVILSGADFSNANLSNAHLNYIGLYGANLKGANLKGANLRGANFINADLSGVDLSGANLSENYFAKANLRKANLNGADLSGTDLSGAILIKTSLKKTYFRGANLSGVDLSYANLNNANLSYANLNNAKIYNTNLHYTILYKASFRGSDLSGADLRDADLRDADLYDVKFGETEVYIVRKDNPYIIESDYYIDDNHDYEQPDYIEESDNNYDDYSEYNDYLLNDESKIGLVFSHRKRRTSLQGADLRGAHLIQADLSNTDFGRANLGGANLSKALLIETNFAGARLTDCTIYGIAAWNVILEDAIQKNLIITQEHEAVITVDNLKVAQFIYLLLHGQDIRQTINTITSQVVLILGRFTNERKMLLEALRDELRNQHYSPVVFNFEGLDNKDFTETVKTLASMARFVLIDLTDLDNTIREITDDIVPRCIVPIRPLFLLGKNLQEYELFRELQYKHRWVLAPYRYKDLSDLHINFQEKIIQPINDKIIELRQKKPLKIFIGYASEDKKMLNKLKTYLRPLERAGLIELWDDQDLAPGEERRKEIEQQLSEARIILLLISPAFLNSDDCCDIQMSIAMKRYEQAEVRVIPILLRPCAWLATPLKELQPLPKDGKPISRHNKDDIFFEVSEGLGDVIKILR